MFLFAVIFLIVALTLIGAGIAVGILVFGAAAVAIGLGMISSSVACGIIQKRPWAGFRIFFYQFFISIFLATGIIATWLASTFGRLDFSIPSILLIGGISGIFVGLLFAVFHSYLLDLVVSQLKRLFPNSLNGLTRRCS